MGQPVVHFEIGGKNRKKLEDFYAKMFDWNIKSIDEMNYGLVEPSGEGSIGGGIAERGEGAVGPQNWATFYIQVDDLQTYLDRAQGLGGKTLVPPTEIPETGAFAWFADPDGNAIGLFRPGG